MKGVAEAVITYLGTVTAVTNLVSTRIHVGELPESEVSNMPRKLVVVRNAGGIEQFRTARLQPQRIDVLSFGEDYYEADTVDLAVAEAVIAIRRDVHSGTLLHSAGYGGAMHLKEPDTGWQYVMRSMTIRAGETAA